ncbi:hypothetical protein IAR50_004469 [Cryptococcus sp. DSM 104548]
MSYNPQHRQSQHYPPQQTPLYDQGPYSPYEELDEPFDVRADFDVKGPRWSGAGAAGGGLGSPGLDGDAGKGSVMGMGAISDRSSYRPVDSQSPSREYSHSQDKSLASREELVSVPVLGPEWRKGELHDMSRRGQSEIQGEKRVRAWREWNRDQRGLCGQRWLSRKVLVMIIFVFLAALGVTLYVLIPRAPTFKFYEVPLSVKNETVNFNRSPTNFSFSGNLNLWGDASSSYLPVHFTHLEATVYDHVTNKKIATGDWGNNVMAHKEQQPVLLPVDFSYSAVNTSDTTWNDMYDACGHIWTGTTRTDLKFRLVLEMSIVGLTKKTSTTLEISDVTCPFELAADGV